MTNKVPTSIRFPKEQIERVEECADTYQTSTSHIIRMATDYYLNAVMKEKPITPLMTT